MVGRYGEPMHTMWDDGRVALDSVASESAVLYYALPSPLAGDGRAEAAAGMSSET